MQVAGGPRVAKRALGAFECFLKVAGPRIRTESVDKMSVGQILELVQAEWDDLPVEQKQQYMLMAKQEADQKKKKVSLL